MALVRIEKNVPEIYVNESRDFQVLCRLYSFALNDILFNALSMRNVLDTKITPDSILTYLCSRLGFFTSSSFTVEELRKILICFPQLVKEKGSLRCIYDTVTLFLNIKHIRSSIHVAITNKVKFGTEDSVPIYTITIGTDIPLTDTKIMDALWEYLLPTGYNVEYVVYLETDAGTSEYTYGDTIEFANAQDAINTNVGAIRHSANDYGDTDNINNRTIGGVDTMVLYSNDDESE